jgi:predicted  nucleic acid-binding Zn-ribbon protein
MGDSPAGLPLTDAEGNLMFPNDSAKATEEIERRKNPSTMVEAPVMSRVPAVGPVVGPVAGPVAPKAKSVKRAFGYNLARQARKLPENIVVINERVQLKEDNFTPVEGGNVGFSADYFPNNIKTPTELLKAKIAFAKIFKPGVLDLENPQPPCNSDEYGFLREGLHNRLNRIRSQVRIYMANEGESAHVRGLQEQGARLKKLLDDIEDKPCSESYEAAEQEESSSYGVDKVSSLDDEKVHLLIRNFAFLVLQALNPIEGFEDIMQIDPVDFINVIDNPRLTSGIMNNFLQEYQSRDYKVPGLIAAILADTNTQQSMLGVMLEQEKKRILEQITTFVTEKTEGFSEFQKSLGGEAGDQIIKIIQWIIEKLTVSAAELSLKKDEIKDLKGQIVTLDTKINDLELAVAAAQTGAGAAATGAGAAAIPASSFGNSENDFEPLRRNSRQDAVDAVAARQASGQIRDLERQLTELQAQLDKCRAERQEFESRIVKNEAGVAITQEAYNNLVRTLYTTNATLAASLAKNRTLQAQIETFTQEKAGVDAELAALKARVPESQAASAALRGQIVELEERVKDYDRNLENLNKLQGEATGMQNRLQAAEEGKRALEAQIRGLTDSITGLRSDVGRLTAELDEARTRAGGAAESTAEVERLKREIAAKDAEIARKQAELERVTAEGRNLRGNLEQARSAAAAAAGAAGAAAATDTARKRLGDIARRIVTGSITAADIDGEDSIDADDKKAFKDLLAKFSNQGTSSSIDVCYLNYFVGFFMRELKFTAAERAAIEERINGLRDTMGKLQEIFTILQSESRGSLDDFFRGVANVDGAIYQRKFPDFYEKVNGITYTVSGSSNPLTPLAAVGNATSISHLTLFTYFLFIARKYLMDNKDRFGSKCPISKFVEDGPGVAENPAARTGGPLSVAGTVGPPAAPPAAPPAPGGPVITNEPLPLSSNAQTIRLIIRESAKHVDTPIGNALSADLENPEYIENRAASTFNKNYYIKEFIKKWRLANSKFYTIPSQISKSLNTIHISDEKYKTEIPRAIEIAYRASLKVLPAFKEYLLDLMKSYVSTYKFAGTVNDSVNSKIDVVFDEFKTLLNPIITTNGIPLFSQDGIKINIKTLKEYTLTRK